MQLLEVRLYYDIALATPGIRSLMGGNDEWPWSRRIIVTTYPRAIPLSQRLEIATSLRSSQ
jgi:hypothetical protein